MLQCEGYKMFYGIATVTPPPTLKPRTYRGTWLYKPETDTWHFGGRSFPAKDVSDFHEINPSTPPNAMDELFSDSMEALDGVMDGVATPRATE